MTTINRTTVKTDIQHHPDEGTAVTIRVKALDDEGNGYEVTKKFDTLGAEAIAWMASPWADEAPPQA